MEEQNTSLIVDINCKGYFRETAKWTKLISFVGIGIGLFMLLGPLYMLINNLAVSNVWIVYVLYFVFSALIVYTSILLYRFSSIIIKAVNTDDNELLAKSIANLRAVFRILGVIILAYFVFLLVGLAKFLLLKF